MAERAGRVAALAAAAVAVFAGCSGPAERLATVESVDVGPPAGRGLDVTYWIGACEEFGSVSVDEAADRVTVRVVVRELEGFTACPAVALRAHVRWELAAPLRSRWVIDGSSGWGVAVRRG